MQQLAVRIAERMAELKLSQREFGRRAGMSQASVWRLLHGRMSPTLADVPQIERALDWPKGTVCRLAGVCSLS